VYGMLSYSVSSRMRELGVRLALGADSRRVMRLVLGEGLRLGGLGAMIGLVGSFALSRLAQSLLPDAPRWDAALIGIAGVIMLAVTIAAAFVPARRAGAVDPIVVLRNDG
jgi:ABC-type antimicrobial peptide transport system permease subunit